MKQSMKILTSSETNDWYTPPHIVRAARECMGGIDLDPASCQAANKWIGANHIYTVKDDGLEQDWKGRVWLNPPYGKIGNKSSQDVWARKLEDEVEAGRVKEACLLTKCVPGYKWWERLFHLWPVCFVRERIEFIRLDSQGQIAETGQAKAGTSIWYVGQLSSESIFRFRDAFNHLGRIIYPPANS